jgi:hypothetical protein
MRCQIRNEIVHTTPNLNFRFGMALYVERLSRKEIEVMLYLNELAENENSIQRPI